LYIRESSAVKRAEFVSDRMLYIILRGHWCDIVLNVHAPTEDRIDNMDRVLDERKQAKLQWLQHQSKINGDNLNNLKCEASRHFRNKKREYLKDEINEMQ
jgi:hypothetical protein